MDKNGLGSDCHISEETRDHHRPVTVSTESQGGLGAGHIQMTIFVPITGKCVGIQAHRDKNKNKEECKSLVPIVRNMQTKQRKE